MSPDGLSPAEAIAEMRRMRTEGRQGPWIVRVARGRYPVGRTLEFRPEDSGTPDAPVRWIGEPGAEISGGLPVVGWTVLADGTWQAPIPRRADGKIAYAEQMWMNGRRATRSCLPAKGRFRLGPTAFSAVTNGASVYWKEASCITNAEIRATLAATPADELQYVQMALVNCFYSARRVVRGFDAATGVLETRRPRKPFAWDNWDWTKETVLENVRAGFRNPGDWFLDVKAGCVRYRPLAGETVETADAVLGVQGVSQVLAVCGSPQGYVHDIVFENIAFAHTGIPKTVDVPGCPPAGKPDPAAEGVPEGASQTYSYQAGCGFDAAITCTGARRVAFRNCRVEHTGNYGVSLYHGCRNCEITDSTLTDLGAGGVSMGYHTDSGPFARKVLPNDGPWSSASNLVENCTISSNGHTHPEACGVAIFHSSDSKVLHCDLHDLTYSGISLGWNWGYSGSLAQRNEVGWNHIWNLGQGLLSDLAGVYTLGTSFGTHIHDNVIHDVDCLHYGGWGLYNDEGSEGILLERNLCYNTEDGGYFLHYGSGIVVRNNIFAWNGKKAAVRAGAGLRKDVPKTLEFVNNIVVTRNSPLAASGSQGEPGSRDERWTYRIAGLWAGNVWWDCGGKPSFDKTLDWTAWVRRGRDVLSVCADPGFVDPERFDFRLKPDSPALKLGFEPWDYGQAGRRK